MLFIKVIMTSLVLSIVSVMLACSSIAVAKTAAVQVGKGMDQIALQKFYKGQFSKIGSSGLFIASQKHLSNYTQIYWAMAHILAKQYGCFMRKKSRSKQYTSFQCRDERIVVFKWRRKAGKVLLTSRQFDKQGREILIRNRKIVARVPLWR